MNQQLLEFVAERISTNLRRKSIRKCSEWAEEYRIMGKPFPGPYTFRYHPWCRDMHDADSQFVIGRKCAQVGYTEVCLNRTFFEIDIHGGSVLYVLPASNPDASDFSSSRFDPALELSQHLSKLFSDVKNVGHKRAGSANLFIRGSRSRNQLKSLPAGLLIFDEVDEMVQENIPLALERASGQEVKQFYLISTPTIENYGIEAYFDDSTQDHYFFPCPHCGKQTELSFPECLVIPTDDYRDSKIQESHLVCKECGYELNQKAKPEYLGRGSWVSSYPDRDIRGFYIPQLYSYTISPPELASAYLKSLISPASEQEFYNSKLGVPHTVEGAQVTEDEITRAIGNYKMVQSSGTDTFTTMGVDIGKQLHFEIDEYIFDPKNLRDLNLAAKCRVLRIGTLQHFEQLDALMHEYKINFCVIDAQPERRKSIEFAQRFWGFVRVAYYSPIQSGKKITVHDEKEHSVTVDRTEWLDLSLGRFRRDTIKIPMDTPRDYKEHIKALVRVYKEDKDGNPIGIYVNKKADHFGHARNYAEIALLLGVSAVYSVDMNRFL